MYCNEINYFDMTTNQIFDILYIITMEKHLNLSQYTHRITIFFFNCN